MKVKAKEFINESAELEEDVTDDISSHTLTLAMSGEKIPFSDALLEDRKIYILFDYLLPEESVKLKDIGFYGFVNKLSLKYEGIYTEKSELSDRIIYDLNDYMKSQNLPFYASRTDYKSVTMIILKSTNRG